MEGNNESVAEIMESEFDGILNSNKIVVVDFYAEWCMPCVMLAPIIEEIAEKMNEVKFVKVNVDENGGLAGKYNVSSIPCLIILKEGKEVERIVGGQSADVIEGKIKKFIE